MNAKIISIINQKGGVAKTTSTEHLGIGLAKAGYRVLLVDADPQGSLTKALGYSDEALTGVPTLAHIMQGYIDDQDSDPSTWVLHNEEGVDLIPSDIKLSGMEMSLFNSMSREHVIRGCLDQLRGNYDYILIDDMPSLGIITINVLVAADSVLIPCTPAFLSTEGLAQLIGTIMKVKKKLNRKLSFSGILITMFERSRNDKNLTAQLRELFAEKAFLKPYETIIPHSVRAKESSGFGVSLYACDPKSTVAQSYVDLTVEFLTRDRNLNAEEAQAVYTGLVQSLKHSGRRGFVIPRSIFFSAELLDKYFPGDWSARKCEQFLIGLLEQWKKESGVEHNG